MTVVAFISHPACLEHDMGPGHPEQPARLSVIRDWLVAGGRYDFLGHYEAPRASREQLARVHDGAYIDRLKHLAPTRGVIDIDADTRMSPGSWEAALRAAGAAVLATDLVMSGEASRAFCNVRPPGHHAERAGAMGFCFFNNVAVGVAHALAAYGLERVAIIDFDVHYGNGTADIFADEPRVLLCSTYQHPLYPGMNPSSEPGHLVNCPLPAGSDGEALREAVQSAWLPALDAFRPQLLYVSAGFDAAAADPLAGLQWQRGDYEWVTGQLLDIAAHHCDGRIVSTLEGGYDLTQLAVCAAAHLAVLMRDQGSPRVS